MENSPLVSVVIVTYNSSETVIETLESIYNQTYKDLELIVSDDCSKDKTVPLCEEWLRNNKDRFYNTQLLCVDKNTGISANLNRAIKKANGIWIKSLAGDDLLEPSCLAECVKFVFEKRCQICMVKLQLFDGNEIINRDIEQYLENNMYRYLKLNNREKQYKRVLYKHILPGPGIFYSKRLWEKIGGFDENYRDFEEYSFELKVLKIERVFFLDSPLVKWRQRVGSLTHRSKSPATINDIDFFFKVRRPLLLKNRMFLHYIDCMIFYYIKKKIEIEDKSILYKLLWLLSPLFYIRYITIKTKSFYEKFVA